MGFIVQYDLVSRDFNVSHSEKHQYLHKLFHGEALRYYYAEIEPLGNSYGDFISKMKFVKAELSGLSFQNMVEKLDGDRRKALRGLVAAIEARIPLFPRDWRNESNNFSSSETRWDR